MTRGADPWRRRIKAPAFRSFLFFVLAYAALLPVLYYGADGMVLNALTQGTARMTAWVLRALGAEGYASGTVVTSSIFGIEIIGECTGLFAVIILVSAILAYPASWSKKAVGVAVGIPALLLVNLFRLVSLFYIGYWFPTWFETAHLIVWQSLMVLITIFLWLLWALWPPKRRESPAT